MNLSSKRMLFFGVSYLCIVCFSIFGLIYNISIVSLNEKRMVGRSQLSQLTDDNTRLHVHILTHTQYQTLEKMADTTYHMQPITTIHFLPRRVSTADISLSIPPIHP